MSGRRLRMDPKGNLLEDRRPGEADLAPLERFARHAEKLAQTYAQAAADLGGQARLEGASEACRELAEFARAWIDQLRRDGAPGVAPGGGQEAPAADMTGGRHKTGEDPR